MISSKRENHKTNQDILNSQIFKRFFFELINRFLHFFYIAFISKNLEQLRNLLFSLFMIDEFRKAFTETILPIIMRFINMISAKKPAKAAQPQDLLIYKYLEQMKLF